MQVIPTIIWVIIYVVFTLPVRMILTVELVSDTLKIATPNIDAFIEAMKKCSRPKTLPGGKPPFATHLRPSSPGKCLVVTSETGPRLQVLIYLHMGLLF